MKFSCGAHDKVRSGSLDGGVARHRHTTSGEAVADGNLDAEDAIQQQRTGSLLAASPMWLEVAVCDTGVGIAQEKQHLLFRAFTQVRCGAMRWEEIARKKVLRVWRLWVRTLRSRRSVPNGCPSFSPGPFPTRRCPRTLANPSAGQGSVWS